MKNGKSIVVIAIAAIMMISVMTAIAPTTAASAFNRSVYADDPRVAFEYDAADDTGLYLNTYFINEVRKDAIRIYGEKGAIYPTHSYRGATDFVYPDAVDAFDPGIISKDSATFNSAYLDALYNDYYAEDPDNAITVDGCDSDEKVFFRMFYEPGYSHPKDTKMSVYYDDLQTVTMSGGSVVAETTYMLLTADGQPRVGHHTGDTHFMLPTNSASVTDNTPGMDNGDMVDLEYAEHGSSTTRGTIEVERTYTNLAQGDSISFMDHEITYSGRDASDVPLVTIKYIGNMNYVEDKQKTNVLVHIGTKYYVDRSNTVNTTTNPQYRWFAEITVMHAGSYDIDVKVGRRLVAGETFYVDGMRYDMPAIYVDNTDGFKYITFQSPIPKCDTVMWSNTMAENQADWSHVTSQWLANLLVNQPVWVLPPFSESHTMIDDIDLTAPCSNEKGIILGTVSPLNFTYINETTEPRYDSNLAERHYVIEGVEEWDWWNVFTKPNHYTEFVLPNDEPDGNEYLITTSFIAPNSEGPERHKDCDKSSTAHDIIDRADTIANEGDTSRHDYLNHPRVAFEYDAEDTTDIYINDDTIRIYGEANAIYPTHSYRGATDFVYPDAVDAFDPGIISKDSATFNPAYMDTVYMYALDPDNAITVDGCDSDEKVFFRMFYEPGYSHPKDTKMSVYYDDLQTVTMSGGSVVAETTYMLLTAVGQPKVGHHTGDTHFMLPISSTSVMDVIPGMDNGDMVDLEYAKQGSRATAGTIEVERTYTNLSQGTTIPFMDHEITYNSRNIGDVPLMNVRYIGNMKYVEAKTKTNVPLSVGTKYYVDRSNTVSTVTDPQYRWFAEITQMHAGSYNIDVKVGRRLVAGETFYVDGMRYDMPAIYVDNTDGFKYITFQSPIPKCETEMWSDTMAGNQADWSHVTSQWLANLLVNQSVWVLPPFSATHTMIDDIDLTAPCSNEKGIILGTVSPLNFYYVNETIEPRFDSNLVERHYVYEGVEEWDWWNVFTKPNHYTEFVLPDDEQGNEYLITTSFIAPNSEGPERHKDCDKSSEAHDIIDRAATLEEVPLWYYDWVCEGGGIDNFEISKAEWHWATGSPKNGHVITNIEISKLEYMWATGDIIWSC